MEKTVSPSLGSFWRATRHTRVIMLPIILAVSGLDAWRSNYSLELSVIVFAAHASTLIACELFVSSLYVRLMHKGESDFENFYRIAMLLAFVSGATFMWVIEPLPRHFLAGPVPRLVCEALAIMTFSTMAHISRHDFGNPFAYKINADVFKYGFLLWAFCLAALHP